MNAILQKRLLQAQYFFQQLENAEDEFVRGCNFSAFLPILKSVYYYIQTWMLDNGKISKKRKGPEFWSKIDFWLQSNFSSDEIEQWDCIMEVRNIEVHKEIASPLEMQFGGYWNENYWNKGYWNDNYWGKGGTELMVIHPKTNKKYRLYDACNKTISITKKLIGEYQYL